MNSNNRRSASNRSAKGRKAKTGPLKKGKTAWNKGMKGTHFSPDTEFKKGNIPSNKLPVGSVRTRQRYRRNGKPRKFIKVAQPNKWELQCHYVWKAHYGYLKNGDVVHHTNGNTLDDRIENIIAMPRSHHPRYHSRWGLKAITPKQLEGYRRRYGKEPTQLEFF